MQDEYKKYLAEIIIDGYTDTDGDYTYNLELSQRRSLAVAEYLTEIREDFLNENQISDLQDLSDCKRTFQWQIPFWMPREM